MSCYNYYIHGILNYFLPHGTVYPSIIIIIVYNTEFNTCGLYVRLLLHINNTHDNDNIAATLVNGSIDEPVSTSTSHFMEQVKISSLLLSSLSLPLSNLFHIVRPLMVFSLFWTRKHTSFTSVKPSLAMWA